MSTEIAVAGQQAPMQITPMRLLQVALEKDSNIDVIERLAKLQREEREYQAMYDFNEALSRCQSQMKRVSADMTNPQTHSKYASYAALDRAIRPVYIAEGFAISFGEAEGSTAEYIVMLGFLSRGGHVRTYRKGMPIDTKGPKGNDVMTKTHGSGAAGSYAKRYLLKDIFNLAVGEDDNDGNGAGAEMAESDLLDWQSAIDGANDEGELKRIYAGAYRAAKGVGDKAAEILFAQAKERAKARLGL